MPRPCLKQLAVSCFLLSAGLGAYPGKASADAEPVGGGCYACALWLPTGANVGAGPRWQDGQAQADLLLGGEISLIDLRAMREDRGFFFGVYVDALYDLRAQRLRTSVGPEFVRMLKRHDFAWGLDLGPAAEWGEGTVRWGGRVRAFLSWAVVSPYVAFTQLFTHGPASLVEAGLLLKFPFMLAS